MEYSKRHKIQVLAIVQKISHTIGMIRQRQFPKIPFFLHEFGPKIVYRACPNFGQSTCKIFFLFRFFINSTTKNENSFFFIPGIKRNFLLLIHFYVIYVSFVEWNGELWKIPVFIIVWFEF